ncbi:hypothetical protein BJ085DRAFT_40873 [Dimargaris cristalligena]|uniref:Uncharacterized protein n=1 Tax=Dimargaris cristalligena TaxID=215637 RepID=A0A4P9ZW16_9FUNG|nr:hypothetical protein BJ085DRAFT_40873 [Dimargaris cristalligena]|eukprot:RKP37797.1 hypothetical protein BJ085DRAFT_40873 [Dimargaris cristalligena]
MGTSLPSYFGYFLPNQPHDTTGGQNESDRQRQNTVPNYFDTPDLSSPSPLDHYDHTGNKFTNAGQPGLYGRQEWESTATCHPDTNNFNWLQNSMMSNSGNLVPYDPNGQELGNTDQPALNEHDMRQTPTMLNDGSGVTGTGYPGPDLSNRRQTLATRVDKCRTTFIRQTTPYGRRGPELAGPGGHTGPKKLNLLELELLLNSDLEFTDDGHLKPNGPNRLELFNADHYTSNDPNWLPIPASFNDGSGAVDTSHPAADLQNRRQTPATRADNHRTTDIQQTNSYDGSGPELDGPSGGPTPTELGWKKINTILYDGSELIDNRFLNPYNLDWPTTIVYLQSKGQLEGGTFDSEQGQASIEPSAGPSSAIQPSEFQRGHISPHGGQAFYIPSAARIARKLEPLEEKTITIQHLTDQNGYRCADLVELLRRGSPYLSIRKLPLEKSIEAMKQFTDNIVAKSNKGLADFWLNYRDSTKRSDRRSKPI